MSVSDHPMNGAIAPWRRTMVESAAIILSILLAFAIDAGWDIYKERRQEQAFLQSLLDDFEETRSRIEESTDRHMRFILIAGELLDLHGGNRRNVEPEKLETMLGAVFFDFTSLYLASGSREALFAKSFA